MLFADLRDETGVTQVVVHDEDLLKGVGRESVISVSEVTRRDESTVNPRIRTGKVELKADALTVLGPCTRNLPFEIASGGANEGIRLKHRFLDLRNPALHENIVLRSKVIGHMRRLMEERGFLEIQTPILTASPEGARVLVPSRKASGRFYALPQAPRFKQLLMVSGFDRYFRSPLFPGRGRPGGPLPGEFYQLDFEMAFSTQEEVLAVCEVVSGTFGRFTDKRELATGASFASPWPLRTDKPDLRNPLSSATSATSSGASPSAPSRASRCGPSWRLRGDWFSTVPGVRHPKVNMLRLAHVTLLKAEGCVFKGAHHQGHDPGQKRMVRCTGIRGREHLLHLRSLPGAADQHAGIIRAWLGQELDLIDKDAFAFCHRGFPHVQLDESTDRIVFTHNPFSMPQGGMERF